MFGGILALVLVAATASASSREQAYRLYSRLTGVPPSEAELASMDALVSAGRLREAAQIATSSYHFYDLTVVRFAHPLSNRDEGTRPQDGESSRVPLNDFVATVVGMTRDNVPFDQVLSGDIVYKGVNGLAGVTAYADDSNDHYRTLGDKLSPAAGGLDLRSAATLERRTQSELRADLPDTAGVMTTRQWANAFFSAGTNRRSTRYAFKGFLCQDMEQVADATAPDTRVRRDVDRAPTGDAKIYLTKCKSCHAGMDGLTGAFAYYNFDNNKLSYVTTKVQDKFNQNAIFAGGYVTTNDSWINFWAAGPDARLGWRDAATTGKGARELGRALARTSAFSSCMAARAFKQICLRAPAADDDGSITTLASDFERGGYNLRNLFEATAVLPQCTGR